MIAPQTSTWRSLPFCHRVGDERLALLVHGEREVRARSCSRAAPRRAAGQAATSIARDGKNDRSGADASAGRRRELDATRSQPYLIFLQRRRDRRDPARWERPARESTCRLTNEKRPSQALAGGPLPVLAHCGAQTTADTVALAAHAAQAGAEARRRDRAALLPARRRRAARALRRGGARLRAAAVLRLRAREAHRATRSRPRVVERLRETVDNLAGMKVSDAPFAKVAAVPPRRARRLHRRRGADRRRASPPGAAGAVSGLASAFPEVVVEAVRSGDSTAAGRAARAGRALPAPRGAEGGRRARRACRCARTCAPPLRGLTDAERARAARAPGVCSSSLSSSIALRARACTSARRVVDVRLSGSGEPARARPRAAGVSCDFVCASFARSSSAGAGPRRRRDASAQERPQPQATGERERAGASRRADATLPPLLVPPVAPSHPKRRPGGGADSVHGKENSGCERLRDHAAAGPGAR